MKYELLIEFTNWLIGINWKIAKHEVEVPSYIAFHFLCFHFCIFKEY
jgi:hypothetical protein